MARANRDHVGKKRPPDEGEISDEIEHFMSDGLIGEASAAGIEDPFALNHKSIVESAPFDQPFFDEREDLFVKRKGAARRNFIFKALWA